MASGQVTQIGKTAKGKPMLVINGKDKYYPGQTDISSLRVGDTIEFESHEFAPGAYGMDQWKLVNGAQKYPTNPIGGGTATIAPYTVTVPPPIGVPVNRLGAPVVDAERACISNVLAACIEKGLITSAVDLLPWVRAAKCALREDQEFQSDKDIP